MFGDLADERKSEANATVLGFVVARWAIEGLEDPLALGFGYPRASVFDGNANAPCVHGRAHLDGCSAAVTTSVFDQVAYHSLEHARIAAHGARHRFTVDLAAHGLGREQAG
jgi:hypothetical protein